MSDQLPTSSRRRARIAWTTGVAISLLASVPVFAAVTSGAHAAGVPTSPPAAPPNAGAPAPGVPGPGVAPAPGTGPGVAPGTGSGTGTGTGSGSSTTVQPAGAGFSAQLTANTKSTFALGGHTVTCDTSTTGGKVLPAPNNAAASGGVSAPISNPTFGNCSPGTPMETAKATTNSTNGQWSVSMHYSSSGTTAKLTIPKAGMVVQTNGVANCTATVTPNGPVTLTGTWEPGSGSTAPKLVFKDAQVPMKVTGGGLCPGSATTATFSTSYDITNTTSPASPITVSE